MRWYTAVQSPKLRAIFNNVIAECKHYACAVWLIVELTSEQSSVLRSWDFNVPDDNVMALRVDRYCTIRPLGAELVDCVTYECNLKIEVKEFTMSSQGKEYPVRLASITGMRLLEGDE